MMHKVEHMWCRWCGGFGMTAQMVCGNSECLTKDMTQGALAGVEILGGRDAQAVEKIKTQATTHYGVMMRALESNSNAFVNISVT